MAKAKAGAKKVKPTANAKKSPKLGAIKKKKAPAKPVKAVAKAAPKAAPVAKLAVVKPAVKPAKAIKGGKAPEKAAKPSPALSSSKAHSEVFELGAPLPDKPMPRASKLPAAGAPLTKREMEQLLTAGMGRGVQGEGSLKGLLIVKDQFPYLAVIGRDKRELMFLLQGPDQEVLPAYADHKVSVAGLIRKTTNYGGTVDVRKYSAKKPDAEPVEAAPQEQKLQFLSPGEIEQLCSPGMAAGVKGYANVRGSLEMTGDEFFLVVSNAGTRQQVSFNLEGKGAKGLRKHLGHTVQVTGVVEKTSGWGGRVSVEQVEPKLSDSRGISRDAMEVVKLEGSGNSAAAEVRIGQGLSVRLQEKPGYIWAIEPTVAKRVSLRESNFEPSSSGPAAREFFFTPRTPGVIEVDFFLAKAFMPAQVSKTYRLTLNVKT